MLSQIKYHSFKSYHKKALILLLLIGFCIQTSFGQLSQVVSQSSIYSAPSPNASSLLRYANIPVDEHTGIASVVLPIDQLSGRQLSAPITLSYHGAGNKVQDIASNVGLGWVLNAGGVLTRVMRGLPDESSTGYQYYGKKVNASGVDSVYLNATINSKIDGEPDMFYFNFMGHTGKLVVDTLGNAQYLPDQGIRVIGHPIHNNPDSTQNAWVLKDFSGTTYIFGQDTSSREQTIVNVIGQSLSKAITYTSSWYLVKVITPDGKETINFNYASGSALNYKQYRNITKYLIHHDVTDTRKGIFSSKIIHHEDISAINVDSIDVSTVTQVLNPKYLISIQNDMGSITFSYHSREDLTGGFALDQIKVYNINDSATPLKTYSFNESYFISPKPNSPTDPDSKRLRLNCVSLQGRDAEVKQLFVFSYNEQTQLPPRNSDEFDHWGYYTTIDNRAGFPPTNITPDKYGIIDEGFERRIPDSVRVQACMLTKVRNVNGGYTNFIYEINNYKFDQGTFIGGGLRIKTIIENDSLGLVEPIIKQYSYTLDDSTSSGMIYNARPYYISGITNYEAGTIVEPIPSLLSYEVRSLTTPLAIIGEVASVALTIAGSITPVGLAIEIGISVLVPVFADMYQFLFHRTHHYQFDSPPFAISSTPLNNLFDINGASVTYSQVAVTNRDGGKMVNYYTSQQEYPDSLSTVELNCLARPVKAIYGNVGTYAPATSFNFERGLLKMSKLYDNTHKLVNMVTNTYQLSKRVSAIYGQRSSVSGYATLTDDSFQVITYNVGLYKEISENIQLTQSVTQLFDQVNAGNSISTIHKFTWQPKYPTLLRSESTQRSDGKRLVNYTTYPVDYALGTTFIDNMVSNKMLGIPIERVSTLQDGSSISITGGVISRYKTGGLGLLDTIFSLTARNPILLSSFKFSNQLTGVINGTNQPYQIDGGYFPRAFYQLYDSKNNLIQSQDVGAPPTSTIWGYHQDIPIAQISNASIDKVAYTSFETNDQRYWQFTGSGRDSASLAKTGKVRYQLGSGTVTTSAVMPAGNYILSFWTQGAKPTISGAVTDVAIVNGESDSYSWNFYMDRITLSGSTHVIVSGSGMMDELRLYPYGAHMSSVTMSPQVGTTSVNSQDDKVNSYEYDPLQRQKTIRDDHYNILKSFAYSNVPPVPCVDTPSRWKGINPVCYTDQNHIVPDTTHYNVIASNSYGNILCLFSRTNSESAYMAKINFTAVFSDNTTYSSSTIIKNAQLSTLMGLPIVGKSAESIKSIGIDTIINLSDDYGVTYQRYTNRQRLRDGYIETNSLTGGLGPYIAPVRSADGCTTPLFSNKQQSGFFKNDCPYGNGSAVTYTVAANTYSASTKYGADSIARAVGQAYANLHGNCTSVDTSFVGIDPYCITSTADSGTPVLSAYNVSINSTLYNVFSATINRSSSEATHDATVTYQLRFGDGSAASYTTPIYKTQKSITFSPPLAGYGPGNVIGVSVTNVVYSGLNSLAYTNRKRLLNGVADGYTEANTTGIYYLAPVPKEGACGTWFYSTAQTGFYKNNCGAGPGTAVSYTVTAHADSSKISQSYADALARVRGQVYANSHGSCYSDTTTMVTTVAGNGAYGYLDGSALSAEFSTGYNITTDANGNIVIIDGNSDYFSIVRKFNLNAVSTLAGTDSPGYVNGNGADARFYNMWGLTSDNVGNVYIADNGNNKIRKITASGYVTTLAGSGYGYVNGPGSSAEFKDLTTIASDPAGNLFVGDYYNYRIRKITPAGIVSTFAGDGTDGYLDGPVSSAKFSYIQTICVSNDSTIYLYDNGRIRKISGGTVSTLAGDGSFGGFADGSGTYAKFGYIRQMVTDAVGNIYATDEYNNCIRKITPSGVVTTITTHSTAYPGGYLDGPISIALFNSPSGLAIDTTGNLYIVDSNLVIRKITFHH